MNWVQALRETILDYDGDFSWGNLDCCQFANDYHKRVTGEDIAAKFDYGSKDGALRILARHGGLQGLFHHVLGKPSDPEPGSVVLVLMSDEGELLAGGVYNGHFVWTVHPEEGLCRVNEARVVEAWQCQQA